MAFEVTCGECGGQLLVESGGVVVECPLCHAHLTIPDWSHDAVDAPEIPVTMQPVPQPSISTPFVAETTHEDSQILARVAEPSPGGEDAFASPPALTPPVPTLEEPTPPELAQPDPTPPELAPLGTEPTDSSVPVGSDFVPPVAVAAVSDGPPAGLSFVPATTAETIPEVLSHSQPNLGQFLAESTATPALAASGSPDFAGLGTTAHADSAATTGGIWPSHLPAESTAAAPAPAAAVGIGELSDHGWPAIVVPPLSENPVSIQTTAPSAGSVGAPLAAVAAVAATAMAAPTAETPTATNPAALKPAAPTSSAPPPANSGTAAADVPKKAAEDVVPRQYFILAAGYASAATLVVLYLLFFSGKKNHHLESLPDLVPEIRKDGAVGIPRVLPKFDLAPDHEMQLGESQRFGNLQVTPLRVTQGPLQFEHLYGNSRATKEATKPVLKLWLQFKNVSKSQEFPALDRALVFRRIFDPKLQSEFALNFLCPEANRVPDDAARHFVYDLPEFSEFALKGQNLDHWIKPGETWETYIPAEEGVANVQGNWVWRVLFRKGLNPKSGRGVTTLIDVKFRSKDVQIES